MISFNEPRKKGQTPFCVLALSGSLRRASYNTMAIKALQRLAPKHVEITLGSIAELPLFNPDLNGEYISALAVLTDALQSSDGLIIASPEYARGISGPMKNALDWLVSGVAFPHKPIMLINTSPRATHAQDALRETLNTMSGCIIEKACISIPLLGSAFDVEGIIESELIANTLQQGLEEFCIAIQALRDERNL